MDIGDSFDSVKSIELEIASAKTFRKTVVRRVVLVLQLELLRLAAPVVHVVRPVNSRPHVYPLLRVFVTAAVLNVELRLLCVLAVLRVRVDPLLLQLLLNYFTLYQSL